MIFGSLLYFVGFFHPSYQLYCEGKTGSAATGCRLTSTYYFLIPWHTQFNVPSLPNTLEQYLCIIGFLVVLLYQSKRIETSFDKNLELLTVKTTWIFSQTKTYPLRDIKKIQFYQSKDNKRHLEVSLGFNKIDLGDISDLDAREQKQLYRTINDFLGLNIKT